MSLLLEVVEEGDDLVRRATSSAGADDAARQIVTLST